MKKIHSQPRPSVIGPPTSHAAVPPIAPVEPQMPSALLRSPPSGKVVIRIESAVGVMMAAATPCTARAGRQAGGERGQCEQPGAGDEHPAPPQQVGGTPAQQQKTAEGEQVGAE